MDWTGEHLIRSAPREDRPAAPVAAPARPPSSGWQKYGLGARSLARVAHLPLTEAAKVLRVRADVVEDGRKRLGSP